MKQSLDNSSATLAKAYAAALGLAPTCAGQHTGSARALVRKAFYTAAQQTRVRLSQADVAFAWEQLMAKRIEEAIGPGATDVYAGPSYHKHEELPIFRSPIDPRTGEAADLLGNRGVYAP